MAEGFLRNLDDTLEVFSAGTKPAPRVNPNAIAVMKEIGIDISGGSAKDVGLFTQQAFDYVITVCDNARETCPVFTGKVSHRLHIGFDDPADATGTPEQVMATYRRVRDEIGERLREFHRLHLQANAGP